MIKVRISLTLVVFSLLFLTACDRNRVFEENVKIDDNKWSSEKPVVLLMNIQDTVNPHNVYINLRNASHYPFSNIFLFMNTTFPDGKLDRDTLEIKLAGADGKWLGDGLGDIWDNRILFKHNVAFPQVGEYRFELIQAMRLDPLPGIMDVGMRVEKVN